MKTKLLLLFMLVSMNFVNAQTFIVENITYQITNTDPLSREVEIFYGSTFSGNLIIDNVIDPNTSFEYSVTNIDDGAFFKAIGLTGVTIPESVKTIETQAFRQCVNLQTVSISNSVDDIQDEAFDACSSLETVTVTNSASNASVSSSIGAYAFRGCTSLSSFEVIDVVTTIGNNSFQNCTSLTNITLPESVTTINDYAFSNTGLTSITIPSLVNTIETASFYLSSNLQTVNLPSSVTSIESFAFRGTGLTYFEVDIETPLTIDGTVFQDSPIASATLKTPGSSAPDYELASFWTDFGTIEDDQILGITSIDSEDIGLKIDSNTLEVVVSSNIEIQNLKVINLLGVELNSSTNNSIDITTLQNGVYIVYVSTNKGIVSKKFLKK